MAIALRAVDGAHAAVQRTEERGERREKKETVCVSHINGFDTHTYTHTHT